MNKASPMDHPRRRFAVGDIHGCSKTMKKMVGDILQLKPDDTLFMLSIGPNTQLS